MATSLMNIIASINQLADADKVFLTKFMLSEFHKNKKYRDSLREMYLKNLKALDSNSNSSSKKNGGK